MPYRWVSRGPSSAYVWDWASYSTTGGTTPAYVWTTSTSSISFLLSNTGTVAPTQETDDQRAVRLAAQNARQEAQAASQARARELLFKCLTPEQRLDFEDGQSFKMQVPSGRRYMIHLGRVGNVFEIDEENRPLARYCIHPVADIPDEDTVLAQKLWLEGCEDEFVRLANVQRRWSYEDEVA